MKAHLGGPQLDASQAWDDRQPENAGLIAREMRDPRSQDPRQQAILKQEQERLAQEQAKMQFSQRLAQRLNPRIGTQEDSDPQALAQFQKAQFMAKLMAQMKQRYPGMQPPQQVPGY